MKVHIRDGDVHLIDLRTRMPFKYGIATMTHSPYAFVRLRIDVEGTPSAGIAADVLPPKWFTKDPARDPEDEVDEMAAVVEHAVGLARDVRADSPFDAWRQIHDAQHQWGEGQGLPPLLTQFGTSLVERAVIEAAGRHLGRPFHEVVRGEELGVRLGEIHPSLAGQKLGDFLGPPLGLITARHTVGLADPLTEGDIPAGERLADGLPQSLEECIRAYGLFHFKIKVTGDLDRDRDRLGRIAGLLDGKLAGRYAYSFDGNEQFRDVAGFRAYWEALKAERPLERFFARLRFVEQPFHRDIALDPDALRELKGWEGRPLLIIDESDAELTSLARALDLGYAGTSHKNCKGVFKSLANAALLHRLREKDPGRYLLSGEDLANVGPVALLQDLAVCACLGIESVERNGHHYFAGLSQFPAEVQQQILEHHGDLYRRSSAGWPTLDLRDGKLKLGSVNAAPFGVGPVIDVERFTPLDDWRRARRPKTP
jgi:hypothetical protein